MTGGRQAGSTEEGREGRTERTGEGRDSTICATSLQGFH